MGKFLISISVIAVLWTGIFGQSGRTGDPNAATPATNSIAELTVAQLFTKAADYARDKFTEFEKKKTPYTQSLHKRVLSEQKQLAAKYANQVNTREGLAGEDFYFLGRLHWLATNATDAAAAFDKFLETNSGDAKQVQTARSVVVVISANGKNLEKAEATLSEYLKSEPKRLSEIAKMEKQMAHSYRLQNDFKSAAPHADRAFEATQKNLIEAESRASALSQLLDSGLTSFEIYRKLGDRERAQSALETLRSNSILVQSHGVYYRAVDEHVKYLIETGRKPLALKMYRNTFKEINAEFKSESVRRYITQRFKKRDPHYRILGETAPKLTAIDRWLPGSPKSLGKLRGKVILLDFWATWCGPCIEAFPTLIKWHDSLRDEGLVILGITRYYGEAEGMKVNRTAEISFLKRFKKAQALPYSLAVADGQANQYVYGATGIPTAVLIDRKGVVRFVESGSSKSRKKEILKMIRVLLAE